MANTKAAVKATRATTKAAQPATTKGSATKAATNKAAPATTTAATLQAAQPASTAQPVKKPPVVIPANVPAGSAAHMLLAAGITTLPASNPAATGNLGATPKSLQGAVAAGTLFKAGAYNVRAGQNAVMWQAVQKATATKPQTIPALIAACGSAAFIAYRFKGGSLTASK